MPEIYEKASANYPERPAFARRLGRSQYQPINYKDLYTVGLQIATALIDRGLGFQDRVAIFSEHRVEWVMINYGVLMAGAVLVPRGKDTNEKEMAFILNHSESRFLFIENKPIYEKVKNISEALEHNPKWIHMPMDSEEPESESEEVLNQLMKDGARLREKGDRRVEERLEQLGPDDLFTLIYTSGTTGQPKGAQLTHLNMLSQVELLPIPITEQERALSILPIWHVYERVFLDAAISRGACTYFTTVRTLADDIESIQPTFMASAPRLWEMLYQRMQKKISEAHPVRRFFFRAAYLSSKLIRRSWDVLRRQDLALKPRNPLLQPGRYLWHVCQLIIWSPVYIALNAGVLEKLRIALGGSFRGTVSGGGALPAHVDAFFNNIGVPVLEGYGLTETAPVLAVRLFQNRVVGTVGPLWPCTDLRIEDPDTKELLYPDPSHKKGGRGRLGEIVVRGPQVMKGYYKNEEETNKVLQDGWFRTGDLGQMTFNDCLRIEGRIKDTVVLSNGENVQPNPIEQAITQSAYIEQAMLVGHGERYLAVLVMPDLIELKDKDLKFENLEEAARSEKLQTFLLKECRKLINDENGFKPFERIRALACFPEELERGKEMTGTLKIKRHVVEKKYADIIKSLFK